VPRGLLSGAPVTRAAMESRGEVFGLRPYLWAGLGEGARVLVWTVVGLPRCSRCDARGPVTVERASGTDLRAQCCGLQLGVLAAASAKARP
jgi:hypothetical protein